MIPKKKVIRYFPRDGYPNHSTRGTGNKKEREKERRKRKKVHVDIELYLSLDFMKKWVRYKWMTVLLNSEYGGFSKEILKEMIKGLKILIVPFPYTVKPSFKLTYLDIFCGKRTLQVERFADKLLHMVIAASNQHGSFINGWRLGLSRALVRVQVCVLRVTDTWCPRSAEGNGSLIQKRLMHRVCERPRLLLRSLWTSIGTYSAFPTYVRPAHHSLCSSPLICQRMPLVWSA